MKERITFNKEMELLSKAVDEEVPVLSTERRDLDLITFPSGESLSVIKGLVGEGEEHYDQLKSGNPLLDTSGSNKLKNVSKNFTVADFAKSGKKVFDKARIDPKLVQCLQSIRDRINIPVIINSGYRSYLYNREIYRNRGQEPTKSQHMSGRAADVKAKGISGLDLAKTAIDVCGCKVSLGLAPDFIHVDIRGKFYVWRYSGLSEKEGKRQVDEIKRYHNKRCPLSVGSGSTMAPVASMVSNNLKFIHNPGASTLDKLPQGMGKQYRSFNWDYYDYPGKTKGDPRKGPNEKKAIEMFVALSKIKPERRPNKGRTAILTKDRVTQYLWNYVKSEMVPVSGQSPHKLNRFAAESFVRMHAAAKKDRVDLIIKDSDRSPQQSQAKAKKSGNPFAVASFSSHNLGLAIDFIMSQGDQKYFETTTRPMKNIINMMQSRVHKWLFQNATSYGWYPWNYEPWHWEYNPDNFRSKFYANCNCDPMPLR